MNLCLFFGIPGGIFVLLVTLCCCCAVRMGHLGMGGFQNSWIYRRQRRVAAPVQPGLDFAQPMMQPAPLQPTAPPPLAVAQAMQGMPTGGMGGVWNPNVICDGSTAQERAIWLQQNQGMSVIAAQQKVMLEFPSHFAVDGGFSGGCGKVFNPSANCGGIRAEERVLWLQQNERLSVEASRQRVMQEFPGSF